MPRRYGDRRRPTLRLTFPWCAVAPTDAVGTVTSGPLLASLADARMHCMKRLVAATFWFIDGWFVGAAVAWALGISPVLAPVLALATAGIIVADPRRIIWARPSVVSDTLSAQRA